MPEYSRMVCGLCLNNMVRLDDERFHCAACRLLWTVESTQENAEPEVKP